MPLITDLHRLDGRSGLLDEPDHVGLLRLTKLVERLFRVPIAYMAFLKSDLTVATRIGSGEQYWDNLKTYPLSPVLAEPMFWPDASGMTPAGFICGDVRFAAAAPLRSVDGLDVGVLVIADIVARPEFSPEDCETLTELARMLAEKMELRGLACQAREVESSLREAESRFRSIANSTPVMIIYSDVDGGVSFVNKTWLEFTGRSLAEELGDGVVETFHPDHRQRVAQAYWTAFRERKPLTIEFPMRRHDGEYRWMETRGIPRFLDSGNYAGYIGCFMDVTDQRSAHPEVRKNVVRTAAVPETAATPPV